MNGQTDMNGEKKWEQMEIPLGVGEMVARSVLPKEQVSPPIGQELTRDISVLQLRLSLVKGEQLGSGTHEMVVLMLSGFSEMVTPEPNIFDLMKILRATYANWWNSGRNEYRLREDLSEALLMAIKPTMMMVWYADTKTPRKRLVARLTLD